MTEQWEAVSRFVDGLAGPPWASPAALALAVVGVALWMGRAGRAMTADGGAGIVAYELAEDVREVHRIFTRWGEAGRRAARASLRIDFLWLLLYAALLAWAALAVGQVGDYRGRGLADGLRPWAVGGALLAGALDAVENVALLRQLRTGPRQPLIRVARVAAQVKFALVALVALYVLAVFGWTRLFA